MPGRLRTSFRSGNLAEELGLLLLKGVAAVAEVPRTEDVGLDAIATLLRHDPDGNCYAEDSFVIQLKSYSERTVEYKDHELTWFLGQTQPMFVGRVSLADAEISIYPTLHVNQAVLALHAKKVEIKFGSSDIPAPFSGQKCGHWRGLDDWGAEIWLGEPLLRWTLADLTDRDWLRRTYEILKRFLGLARRELELISFGQSSVLEWSTNDLPSITSKVAMMKSGLKSLASLAESCTPSLSAILMQAITMPGDTGNSLSLSLLAFIAALRDHGVEIDPGNLFGNLFIAIKQNPPPRPSATQTQSRSD